MLLRPNGLLGTRGHQEGLSDRARPRPGPPSRTVGRRRERRARARAGRRARGRVAARLGQRIRAAARFVRARRAAALLPLVVNSDYIVRVGVNTLIYALLALGLNVVVGWAGLLDLGYVAFYGFGAYVLRDPLVRPVQPALAGGRERSR